MTAREYKQALYNAVSQRENDLNYYLCGVKPQTTQWYVLNGRLFATNEMKQRVMDMPTGEGKNVDWLREMDVTKLAEFLADRGCPDRDTIEHCCEKPNCVQCWLDWLNDYGGE